MEYVLWSQPSSVSQSKAAFDGSQEKNAVDHYGFQWPAPDWIEYYEAPGIAQQSRYWSEHLPCHHKDIASIILDKHYRCTKVVLRPLSQRKPNISKEERSKKEQKKKHKVRIQALQHWVLTSMLKFDFVLAKIVPIVIFLECIDWWYRLVGNDRWRRPSFIVTVSHLCCSSHHGNHVGLPIDVLHFMVLNITKVL